MFPPSLMLQVREKDFPSTERIELALGIRKPRASYATTSSGVAAAAASAAATALSPPKNIPSPKNAALPNVIVIKRPRTMEKTVSVPQETLSLESLVQGLPHVPDAAVLEAEKKKRHSKYSKDMKQDHFRKISLNQQCDMKEEELEQMQKKKDSEKEPKKEPKKEPTEETKEFHQRKKVEEQQNDDEEDGSIDDRLHLLMEQEKRLNRIDLALEERKEQDPPKETTSKIEEQARRKKRSTLLSVNGEGESPSTILVAPVATSMPSPEGKAPRFLQSMASSEEEDTSTDENAEEDDAVPLYCKKERGVEKVEVVKVVEREVEREVVKEVREEVQKDATKQESKQVSVAAESKTGNDGDWWNDFNSNNEEEQEKTELEVKKETVVEKKKVDDDWFFEMAAMMGSSNDGSSNDGSSNDGSTNDGSTNYPVDGVSGCLSDEEEKDQKKERKDKVVAIEKDIETMGMPNIPRANVFNKPTTRKRKKKKYY